MTLIQGEEAIAEANVRFGDMTRLKGLRLEPMHDSVQRSNILQLGNLQGLEYLNLGDVYALQHKYIKEIARLGEYLITLLRFLLGYPFLSLHYSPGLPGSFGSAGNRYALHPSDCNSMSVADV